MSGRQSPAIAITGALIDVIDTMRDEHRARANPDMPVTPEDFAALGAIVTLNALLIRVLAVIADELGPPHEHPC